jgi:integrase
MGKTYSAKEPPPPPEEREFPMEVRHKKAASVTLYESPNRGTMMYTVAYPFDGRRQRKMRRNFEDAFALAKEIALKMADGALNVLTLEGRERFVYERAVELAGTTKMDLDVLVLRAVEAANIIGGPDHLIEAARLYQSQRRGVVHKMVSEVITELIENRRSNGASQLYLRDLRVRLENRFAVAFRVPISSITTGDIQRFLDGLKCKQRTKKNFLTTIGTLFSFAKNRGYVHEMHPGISRVEFKSAGTAKIEIFSVAEIETLLNNARQELVPVLAIGAFAGLRSEEIKRLEWTGVHFGERFIEVGADIAKNRVRRIVPMSDNLCRWLLPYRRSTGRVYTFSNLAIQFAKLAKAVNTPWRKNGLRHSFISYRVAKTENVEKVALEAGNSSAVIRSNYLKMVTGAQGRRWFSIKPPSAQKIIRLGEQVRRSAFSPR